MKHKKNISLSQLFPLKFPYALILLEQQNVCTMH